MFRLFVRMHADLWLEVMGHGCYTQLEVDDYKAMFSRLGTDKNQYMFIKTENETQCVV